MHFPSVVADPVAGGERRPWIRNPAGREHAREREREGEGEPPSRELEPILFSSLSPLQIGYNSH
jgi:hypothetical protein